MVVGTASDEALDEPSDPPLVILYGAFNDGGVIRELLRMARNRVIVENQSVKSEEDWCQKHSLGGADAAEHSLRDAAVHSDMLWSADEVVLDEV